VSSSIRPPGGSGPSPSGLDSPLGTEESGASRAAGGISGSEAPQVAAGSQAERGAASQAAAAPASPTAQWIRRLEAGEISREQAIDGLVAQALEAQGGARLAPALRSELESVLRAALVGDPVLGRLLGEP
jgi:hypothetical protein